eukprot:GAHX01000528.1.p2 GENE.GAHX01000528.1~~GAHX01000528.1.p2  ORF type:complete len:79 (+),score=0.53 GAHX01000528.1:114-350(+)
MMIGSLVVYPSAGFMFTVQKTCVKVYDELLRKFFIIRSSTTLRALCSLYPDQMSLDFQYPTQPIQRLSRINGFRREKT